MKVTFLYILFWLAQPTSALAAGTAAALADHSAAAIGLFNNMRTPAALIGGSLVPLGILNAPKIEKADSKTMKFVKKANVVLGVTSLLSEMIAVTYASIAINKLAELESPLTKGCAELIAQHHEMAWIGTNVHFLYGLLGFGLIVGSKGYFVAGSALGKVTLGWSFAAFLQALAIVNKGVAMGHGQSSDVSARFAGNFFGLILRYIRLTAKSSKYGIAATAALIVGVWTIFQTIKLLISEDEE